MSAAGYNRTLVQRRDKIKKVRAEYRKVKDHNSESGRERKDLSYFDKLDAILGHRPATQPGTSNPVGEEANISTVSEPEENERYTESTGDTSRESSIVGEQVEELDMKCRKRKREVRKEVLLEKAMDKMITSITKMQEESDKAMHQLEEKRLKLDERMLEMEARHWEREDQYRREQQRREDERRREEHQFQLSMMQLMRDQQSYLYPPYTPLEETSQEHTTREERIPLAS